KDICVLFAYCRYTDPIPVTDILSALVKQYLEDHPSTARFIKPLFDYHEPRGTRPTQAELLDVLKKIASSGLFAKTFYVIDGLDEASNDVQVDTLAALSSLPIHCFITSRPLALLQERVRAKFLNITVHDKDILILVEDKISRTPTLQKLLQNSEWKTKVVERLLERSSGMFLLASLYLEMLGDCLTIQSLKEALDKLPDGIHGMYAATMKRIEKQSNADLAKKALTWIAFATRSLMVDELGVAIAIDPETLAFDPERRIDTNSLLSLCCGLITLDQDGMFVRAIHYTAIDFLKSYLVLNNEDPHSVMASACVGMLLQFHLHCRNDPEHFHLTRFLWKTPFLGYAYETWAFHGRNCKNVPSPVKYFIQNCERFPVVSNKQGSVHVCAMYGFPEVLEELLETTSSNPINTKTKHGLTPLIFGARSGHTKVVKLLLTVRGVDVNVSSIKGKTALMKASRRGHLAIVKALLEHTTPDVNATDKNGKTAIMKASMWDHAGVVTALLGVGGVDINCGDNNGLTALMGAAERGFIEVLKAFLDREDLDVNAVDAKNQTALMKASGSRRFQCGAQVVEVLLKAKDIDVNAASRSLKTALMKASRWGRSGAVVALLKADGISINAQDRWGETALMKASKHGHSGAVRALLEVDGIQVNAVDNRRGTALKQAAMNGHSGVVKMLLGAVAIDIDVLDSKGRTALVVAQEKGHGEVARLLRNHRAT
ncbi:ankyrin, partial [Coprinopsis marcescibilis]